jgi:ubiquitin-like modifier-activating enzyme 5
MEAPAGPAADIKVTTTDLRSQVGRIQNQVKEIQEVVRMYSSTTGPRRVRRQKIEVMSAEAVDTNPYSRLMALKSLGIVKNYDSVVKFSVAIVGVGGVGVGVCEMLTRCGIGKIIMYDFDTIELANMNKMFYRPEQAGWAKTMACRHYCSELNPDTTFEVHNINITTDENRAKFKETIASGSVDRQGPVSLIIGCCDSLEARQAMEAVSEELQVPFMDAVVADDAMSGHVQLIIPGRTGGLEASPIKQQMEKRPGTCPASLPTTDSIISGCCAQNVLKYLLGFGEVAFLLSYNAVTNDFTTRMTYPDPRKLAPTGEQ